jgi:hypothetical protein
MIHPATVSAVKSVPKENLSDTTSHASIKSLMILSLQIIWTFQLRTIYSVADGVKAIMARAQRTNLSVWI